MYRRNANSIDFGECPECGEALKAEWFIEEEYETVCGTHIKTGRKRYSVDYLYCPACLTRQCVDDSFDGPWHN